MMTPKETAVSLFDECKRLQGEIADLKRQLAEQKAALILFHKFCCDNGRCFWCEEAYVRAEAKLDAIDTAALDACVQEKVQTERDRLRKVQDRVDRAVLAESEWWMRQMGKRDYHFDLWGEEAERLAANRAKVKP